MFLSDVTRGLGELEHEASNPYYAFILRMEESVLGVLGDKCYYHVAHIIDMWLNEPSSRTVHKQSSVKKHRDHFLMLYTDDLLKVSPCCCMFVSENG